jgi:hypothetical protein
MHAVARGGAATGAGAEILRGGHLRRAFPFVCGVDFGQRQAGLAQYVIFRRGLAACPGKGLRRRRARQGNAAITDRPADVCVR